MIDNDEPTQPLEVMLDPEYQANMMVIDDAMDLVGRRGPARSTYPSYYDDALLKLIDAVPLED